MTEQEALDVIAKLVTAIQRYRSMAKEELPDAVMDIANVLQEYTLGNDDPLLLEVLMKVQQRGTLTPIDFYNFMYMAHHTAPEAGFAYAVVHGEDLPELDISMLAAGWDD